MHQTTSANSDFRRSLEGYAKAGIRHVEVIPPMVEPFVRKEGLPAARRLLSDLGMKAVASGGVRGLAEPHPGRAKALEELKARAALLAELGVDRMVCPSNTSEKFTADDYRRGVDNLREAGEIVKPLGVTAMLEFMRGSTFIGTLPTALRVTREAAHSHVRPMFDFYHFWAGLSKFEDLDLIRPGEIHHVHFQDVPAIPRELLDNGTRDVPGDGTAPLAPMLEKLKAKGYSGPLSVELFYPHLQQGDPYEVALRIRRQSEPILRKAGVA
jgi:sugar phosphate isomerase/epimerase